MKCYECKWLDRSVILTSNPPQYGCTLGFGSHYADHECEYDFMPIVRCKDCRYYSPIDENKPYPCEVGIMVCNKDDYCSYGERSNEMMTITDTRTDVEKHLHEIWPSDFFIWGDEVYRRIEDNQVVSLKYNGEGIPAVHQRSGEIDIIDRDAWVVPCRCELIIIE